MKCPACYERGLTSRLTVNQYGTSTSMGGETYYDKQGKYHSHDPNSHGNSMSCSNGHKLNQSSRAKCSACDYNTNRTSVVLFDKDNQIVSNYKPVGDDTWKSVKYTLSLHGNLLGYFMTDDAASLGRQAHRQEHGWNDEVNFNYYDYNIDEIPV